MTAYGCHDMTRDAIGDLEAQDIPTKVLLVDNSPHPLAVHGESFHFPENKGVAGGWNFGMQHLLGRGADHVLVVNNDVRLRKDTYRLLLEPLGGFVSGVGRHTRGEMVEWEHLNIGIHPPLRGGPDFSCFVIHRWFYEAVGPFNEEFYPGYREDNAYHARANLCGLGEQIFSVSVPYWHIDGGSGAIKNYPALKALVQSRWDENGRTYERLFGGPPGRERFYTGFQRCPA